MLQNVNKMTSNKMISNEVRNFASSCSYKVDTVRLSGLSMLLACVIAAGVSLSNDHRTVSV